MARALTLLAIASILAASSPALADPCLVVYPGGETIYHYDTNEHYTVGPGDPLYDPFYDRGGEVLLDVGSNEVSENIYQAPGLAGFQPSVNGQEGYFTNMNPIDLIVDGFNNNPTTFVNVILVLDIADGCDGAAIFVDGQPALFDSDLGWYYPLGDIEVSTPTASGNNFSNTIQVDVFFAMCESLRLWAFSDENFNLNRDGGECFTAFSHDATVPVEASSWGNIKSVYR